MYKSQVYVAWWIFTKEYTQIKIEYYLQPEASFIHAPSQSLITPNGNCWSDSYYILPIF